MKTKICGGQIMFIDCLCKKIKGITLLSLLIATLMATMSCVDNNPFNQNDKGKTNICEIFARLRLSTEADFAAFLRAYSRYDLKITHKFHQSTQFGPIYFARLTFNSKRIDTKKLLALFENDDKVWWSSSSTGYIEGELTITLQEHVKEKILDEFILSFAEYEMKLIFHDKWYNRIRVSFDRQMIKEFQLIDILFENTDVQWVFLGPMLPDWTKGEVYMYLHEEVYEHDIDDFIFSLSEYEVKKLAHYHDLVTNILAITFNYDLIDEFEFLEMINHDPRVIQAGFHYLRPDEYD